MKDNVVAQQLTSNLTAVNAEDHHRDEVVVHYTALQMVGSLTVLMDTPGGGCISASILISSLLFMASSIKNFYVFTNFQKESPGLFLYGGRVWGLGVNVLNILRYEDSKNVTKKIYIYMYKILFSALFYEGIFRLS